MLEQAVTVFIGIVHSNQDYVAGFHKSELHRLNFIHLHCTTVQAEIF